MILLVVHLQGFRVPLREYSAKQHRHHGKNEIAGVALLAKNYILFNAAQRNKARR